MRHGCERAASGCGVTRLWLGGLSQRCHASGSPSLFHDRSAQLHAQGPSRIEPDRSPMVMRSMLNQMLEGPGRWVARVAWLVVLLLSACAAGRAVGAQDRVNAVYRRFIAKPAVRTARAVWCQRIQAESPPMAADGSERAQDEAEWASGRLSLKQADCAYVGDLYSELRFAAVHHILGRGAWLSCQRLAPVGAMRTALQLAIYVQCLQQVWGSPACRAVRRASGSFPISGPHAACGRLLRSSNWSQWGEPVTRGRSRSLFSGTGVMTMPSADPVMPVLRLPTAVTLTGTLLIGFDLGCCDYGMGYMWPSTFLRLDRSRRMSQGDVGSDLRFRRITLDRRASRILLGTHVLVRCTSLWIPATATGPYCRVRWIHGVNRGSPRASSSTLRGADNARPSN